MAKTYLEATLETAPKVVLMDYASSIGGTWATERLYPGLKTNNIVGSYEFSDYPLNLQKYDLKPGQHIPGTVVHDYLSTFVDEYDLNHCIRFETKVDAATLQDDGEWLIDYTVDSKTKLQKSRTGQLVANKLVVATGLTSEPFVPDFPGKDTFKGNLFHAKELKFRSDDLTNSKNVVVIGGNKSAWDVCYAAALAGAQVHMVIRPSGGGPSWVWPAPSPNSKVRLAPMSLTRYFTWFDPIPFGGVSTTARDLLHRTVLGRIICWLFWAMLDRYVQNTNGYHESDLLGMLKPWTSIYWAGNSLSIHNYETDWWELAKNGQIVVHHADVTDLTETTARLSDGQELEVDTIVCCTGWKSVPSIKFGPPEIVPKIGLPQYGKVKLEGLQSEAELISKARKEILKQRPELRSKPIRRTPKEPVIVEKTNETIQCESCQMPAKQELSPYRLYRFVVPPSETFLQNRNLAFIGMHLSIHALILAQVQALWITSFFLQKLPLPLNPSTVLYETYLHTEYAWMRRPHETGGSGDRFPDLLFDSLGYVDLLLGQMGMERRRKGGGWREVKEPYGLRDYRDLVNEWMEGCRRREEGEGKGRKDWWGILGWVALLGYLCWSGFLG